MTATTSIAGPRRARVRPLASLVMICLFGPLAPGAHADRAMIPTLHGLQTISSAQPASRTEVIVPNTVHLPGNNTCLLSDTARFTGTAKHAALFLTSLPLRPDSRVIWLAHATWPTGTRSFDNECLATAIPEGHYLLQYVHTPGTSSVTLRLPGLSGAGALTPTGQDRSLIRELPRILPSAADPAVDSWGARDDLHGRGSVLNLGAVQGALTDSGAGVIGDCLLGSDGSALPDPVAYAPGCPAGGSGISSGFTGKETWSATLSGNLSPGSWGAGFWFAGTPTHTSLGAVSVWLTNLTG